LDDSSLNLISDPVYWRRLPGVDGCFDPTDRDASRLSFQFDFHHDRAVSSDVFVSGKAHAAAMAAVSGYTFGPPKPIRGFCHDGAGAGILHMRQAKCQRILAAGASALIHHAF